MTSAEIGRLAIAEGRAYVALERAAAEWDASSSDRRRLDAGMRVTQRVWVEARAVLRAAVMGRIEQMDRLDREQLPSLERIRAIREGQA